MFDFLTGIYDFLDKHTAVFGSLAAIITIISILVAVFRKSLFSAICKLLKRRKEKRIKSNMSSHIIGFIVALNFIIRYVKKIVLSIGEEKRNSKKIKAYSNAYDNREYEKAFKILKPVAESGYAEAQNRLGVMYSKGQGVKQNDEEAIKWYKKSAGQGYALAQYNLGEMYMYGRERVAKDEELGIAWLLIAKVNNSGDAGSLFATIDKTREMMDKAHKLKDKMVEENPLLLQSNHKQSDL